MCRVPTNVETVTTVESAASIAARRILWLLLLLLRRPNAPLSPPVSCVHRMRLAQTRFFESRRRRKRCCCVCCRRRWFIKKFIPLLSSRAESLGVGVSRCCCCCCCCFESSWQKLDSIGSAKSNAMTGLVSGASCADLCAPLAVDWCPMCSVGDELVRESYGNARSRFSTDGNGGDR